VERQRKIAGVMYIGEEPCPVVMEGSAPIRKGAIITASDEVLAYLASRGDFTTIEADGEPAVSAETPAKE